MDNTVNNHLIIIAALTIDQAIIEQLIKTLIINCLIKTIIVQVKIRGTSLLWKET